MQQQTYAELKSQFPLTYCRDLAMFGALSDESLTYLLEQGNLIHCAPGDKIYSANDTSESFYIIISGGTRFHKAKEVCGQMVELRYYKPGEQVGFVGMIGLQKRHGNQVMEDDGYLLEIPAELFHHFCEKFPEEFKILMINVTREMSREISDLDTMCTEYK
ncbi:cyclic nucleotide-binding domain-containing protein [Pontibacterium sp. N1Y112]|uniref:Cyclic nucleotide-binding domain-containing protein n=1 Tax=Pontibacterium sinense TaxID=2781979 RepID=A0A8J7FDS0_9GAMM|nr:cyclic nucleotide-binding domain-containing protein [Pontibacterium sinense]MBE9398182.1 cyclic nucleotide-binding domain-containing protein [Pontibacterium sinense]